MMTVARKARGPTDGCNRWLNGEKTGLNVKQSRYGVKRELHSASVMKVIRKMGNFTYVTVVTLTTYKSNPRAPHLQDYPKHFHH